MSIWTAISRYYLAILTYKDSVLIWLTLTYMSKNSISVRMPEEDKALLEKVCKARGEDVSDFARRSIRKELASLSFLSSDEKKALGVKTEDPIAAAEGV